jgi:hypothetical protein
VLEVFVQQQPFGCAKSAVLVGAERQSTIPKLATGT